MNKTYLLGVVCACLVSFSLPVSAASYVYSYAGNTYNSVAGPIFSTSMSISGYFEIPAPLDPDLNMISIDPVSFSFSNGARTLTDISSSSQFTISTNATGKIDNWEINITERFPTEITIGDRIHRVSIEPIHDYTFVGEYIGSSSDTIFVAIVEEAWSIFNTGTWTVTAIPTIDIRPSNNSDNEINLKKDKFLQVTILGDETFDALQVDPETVRFGPTGVEASPTRVKGNDYDRDGYADLILTFKTLDSGIGCEDTEAILTGETYTDPAIAIKGTDNITVVCP